MGTQLNPYLSFRGNAMEAMEFYRSVFGGELTSSTFADFHATEDPAEKDKVMHARLATPGGLTLMASDTPDQMEYTPGSSISISLSGEDEAELRRSWEGLTKGGTVIVPLGPAPWGDTFGMCTDKFGVNWMVDIGAASERDSAPAA